VKVTINNSTYFQGRYSQFWIRYWCRYFISDIQIFLAIGRRPGLQLKKLPDGYKPATDWPHCVTRRKYESVTEYKTCNSEQN